MTVLGGHLNTKNRAGFALGKRSQRGSRSLRYGSAQVEMLPGKKFFKMLEAEKVSLAVVRSDLAGYYINSRERQGFSITA